LENLKENERPDVMKWYKYSKVSERQKNPDIKRELITAEEYSKIIQNVRMDLRMLALYKTLYLNRARPN
jgi:hypothetical protein